MRIRVFDARQYGQKSIASLCSATFFVSGLVAAAPAAPFSPTSASGAPPKYPLRAAQINLEARKLAGCITQQMNNLAKTAPFTVRKTYGSDLKPAVVGGAYFGSGLYVALYSTPAAAAHAYHTALPTGVTGSKEIGPPKSAFNTRVFYKNSNRNLTNQAFSGVYFCSEKWSVGEL
jgi:hypothetical protein